MVREKKTKVMKNFETIDRRMISMVTWFPNISMPSANRVPFSNLFFFLTVIRAINGAQEYVG